MDRRHRTKVWKDRLAFPYPAKWCWEVWERTTNSDKVIACGTTASQRQSREAAQQVVERRLEGHERSAA